jgi:hypothetical protein
MSSDDLWRQIESFGRILSLAEQAHEVDTLLRERGIKRAQHQRLVSTVGDLISERRRAPHRALELAEQRLRDTNHSDAAELVAALSWELAEAGGE